MMNHHHRPQITSKTSIGKFTRLREKLAPMLSSGSECAAAVAADEEADEEQRLVEQCCSSSYFKHTKLIRLFMRLYSMKLVSESTYGLQQVRGLKKPELQSSLCNVLRPECRPENCRPRAVWLGRRLVWPSKVGLLTAFYLYYTLAKLIPLATLSLKRHIILRHLKPSLQPKAQRTVGCALSGDLYFSKPVDQSEFEHLKSLDSWLKFIGISMVSLPEFSVPHMFMVAILPVFLHHMWQLLLWLHRRRVDTLCFLLDPLGERRRLGAELRNIVRELILSQSIHKGILYSGLENSEALHDGKLVFGGFRAGSFEAPERPPAGRRRFMNEPAHRPRYLPALFKVKQLKHVDPYIVTCEWHRTLLRRFDVLLKMAICLTFIVDAIVVLGSLLYDLCYDTRLRLEMVECTKWHPGGTRIAAFDHLYLDELKSAEQVNAYKAHDGSTLSFLKLALLVESTNYFLLRRVIAWGEHLLAVYILFLGILFSCGLHLASTIEKLVWLSQLDQQVDYAANQAAEQAYLARRFGSSQADVERLLELLTLVYLNYELFRRQQDAYLMLINPLTTCLSLFLIMIFLVIHFSGVSLGNSSPLLIFVTCSPILLGINLFLVASSYRMKQMEKIMIKATRILAHCSSGSIHLSYPVELWRRQVFAFEESCLRYASRLFGINITYETVISLNGYAIALLIILLKPQRGPLR